MTEITDQRKWRISKSGFTIRTGWGDEKKFIAQYPGKTQPLDSDKFNEWLDNAEIICEQYNAALSPLPPVKSAIEKLLDTTISPHLAL